MILATCQCHILSYLQSEFRIVVRSLVYIIISTQPQIQTSFSCNITITIIIVIIVMMMQFPSSPCCSSTGRPTRTSDLPVCLSTPLEIMTSGCQLSQVSMLIMMIIITGQPACMKKAFLRGINEKQSFDHFDNSKFRAYSFPAQVGEPHHLVVPPAVPSWRSTFR